MKTVRSKLKGWIVMSVIIGCMIGIVSAPVRAADVLKFSHSWVKGDIRDNWANDFAAFVEKGTNGAIKFEMHPGAVLFKPKSQFDAIRKGALDLCIWPLGWTSGKIPQLALPELPGLIESPEKGARFAASEAGKRLAEIAAGKGMKILAWGWLPTSMGAKEKKIEVPSDLKGMKMRGAVKPVEMTFQSAGAAITKMPSTEVYMALQTGTLDGLFTTNASFGSFRLHEVVKYLTMGKKHSLINGLFAIIMSPDKFKKFTPEQQQVIMQAGVETTKAFQSQVDEITAKTEKAFLDAGRTVIDMNAEQYKLWVKEAEKSAWKWYREKVKGGAELLELALKVK
jgi:TRAP-type C4-dicarboxylate transport system substrate-binding protein